MIYLLDAAALLNNELFSFDPKHRYFTTSKVFAEWRGVQSRLLAENAFSHGMLVVQDPCGLSTQKAAEKCEESGTLLGDADISIVALAAEFKSRKEKFLAITDDYSVQNVLKKMGVGFIGVCQGEIRKHRVFKKRKK